jgi:hypothetical protein
MSTLVKERAVFAAVSILALALVTLFGGSYAAPADGRNLGPAEPEAGESYMLQPDVSPVLKAYAQEKGAADGNPSGQDQGEGDGEKQAEESEDRDTYDDENVTGSASRLGSRYVLGFYVDDEYILPSSYDRMVKYGKNISAVAPFWYRLSPEDGSILQQHHPEEGFTDKKMKRIIEKAHEQGMEVLMLVHNMLYGGRVNGKELAKEMLATGESRKAFIDNVEAVLGKFGYDGINIIMKHYSLAAALLVLYGVIVVTRQIIEPKIMGKNIGLHPLATLISLYIGMRIFGIIGILIGPLTLIVIKALQKTSIIPRWKEAKRP